MDRTSVEKLALAALLGVTLSVAASAAELPPLAARYTETVSGQGKAPRRQSEWYFARHADRVETARDGLAEAWLRDERGDVRLARVFHAERKLIEYTPGQLRTEGREPEWTALASILDPAAVARLPRVGHVTVLGRRAERRIGRIDGERVQVDWLVAEGLPARYARSGPSGTVVLRLRELREAPGSAWPMPRLHATADYEALDGSDLGDREYEPFVRRVLALDAARRSRAPQHGQHAH